MNEGYGNFMEGEGYGLGIEGDGIYIEGWGL